MGTPAAVAADQVTGTCPMHLIPNPASGAPQTAPPPHVGLHPADPFFAPPMQQAVITQGSTTVLFGGVPTARTGSQATCCAQPVGTLTASAASVLIGG